MKNYTTPIAAVMNFEAEDILTLSIQAKGPGSSFDWDSGSANEVY